MKHKSLLIIVTAVMLVASLSALIVSSDEDVSAWDGVTTTPMDGNDIDGWTISSAEQLAYLSEKVNIGMSYYLVTITITADIDLGDNVFCPIGTFEHPFDGKFNGDSIYTISNLKTDSGNAVNGLFGYVKDIGVVENVNLVDVDVQGIDDVGGIAGINNGRIDNCTVTGIVKGTNRVGGIVGTNNAPISGSYPSVENCHNYAAVNGTSDVGGIVGVNYTKIINCVNEGSFGGLLRVGGITGYNQGNAAIISDSLNEGFCSGDERTGGIAGLNEKNIERCTNTGTIHGTGNTVGGIAGFNLNGKISESINKGNINGSKGQIGGIAGRNDTIDSIVIGCINEGTIKRVWTGSLSGNGTGGIAGSNAGIVTESYNIGNIVSEGHNNGGIVGLNTGSGDVNNCYNRGDISGKNDNGGIVGNNTESSTISFCYNTGKVTGTGSAGPIVGDTTTSYTDSYWLDWSFVRADSLSINQMTGIDAVTYMGFNSTFWRAKANNHPDCFLPQLERFVVSLNADVRVESLKSVTLEGFLITLTAEYGEAVVEYSTPFSGPVLLTADQETVYATVPSGSVVTLISLDPSDGEWFIDGISALTNDMETVYDNVFVEAKFTPAMFDIKFAEGVSASFNATYNTGVGGEQSIGFIATSVPYGTVITFGTVTPDTGYEFVSWTVNGSQVSTAFVTVTENMTISIELDILWYNIKLGDVLNGQITVTYDVGDGINHTLTTTPVSVPFETLLTLVNTEPNIGYYPTSWNVNGSYHKYSTAAVSSDIVVSIEFLPMMFDIELEPALNGTITATYNVGDGIEVPLTETQVSVPYGTIITFGTATPDTGYAFKTWTMKGSSVTDTPITVTQDLFLSAQFEIMMFNIQLGTVSNGTVSATYNTGVGGEQTLTTTSVSVPYGTVITLVSYDPETGYEFVKWIVNGVTGSSPVTVTADTIVSAEFTKLMFDIQVATPSNGTITVTYDTGVGGEQTLTTTSVSVPYGTVITFVSKTPSTGYVFSTWTVNGSAETSSVTVDANMTISATFVQLTFTIDIGTPSNGTIDVTYDGGTPLTGSVTVPYGTVITFVTKTPSTGFTFVTWTVNGSSVGTSTVTVTENMVISAEFIKLMFDIKLGSPSHGTVIATYDVGDGVDQSLTTTTVSVPYGTVITFVSATPDADHIFVRWTINGTHTTDDTHTVTGNVTISAEFSVPNVVTESLTINPSPNGVDIRVEYRIGGAAGIVLIVTDTAKTIIVPQGTVITLISATPAGGFALVGWTINGADATTGDTYTVVSTTTVSANFEEMDASGPVPGPGSDSDSGYGFDWWIIMFIIVVTSMTAIVWTLASGINREL